jgi:hypothetical protein
MELSRRSFIASVVTGSTLAALSPPALARAATRAASASPVGDVVGKITVGYQGWFACLGDGAPINGWWHWSQNWSQPPSPGNNVIKAWPDMRLVRVRLPDRVRQPQQRTARNAVLLL